MLLNNAEFLQQLEALLEAQTTSGSVFITQKRYTFEDATTVGTPVAGDDEEMPAASTSNITDAHKEYPCIIKATNGKHAGNKAKKVKISTLVQSADTDSFALTYGTMLKAHFAKSMRKKSKKRKEKEKTKAQMSQPSLLSEGKRRRRQTRGGLPKVIGARRGNGHAKRRRTLKSRVKAARRILEKQKVKMKDEAIIACLPRPTIEIL